MCILATMTKQFPWINNLKLNIEFGASTSPDLWNKPEMALRFLRARAAGSHSCSPQISYVPYVVAAISRENKKQSFLQ